MGMERMHTAVTVAREVLERGTFTGEPMPTDGECGDEREGSWLGWRLRVWNDGRWNVTPADKPVDQPTLSMHCVLTHENTVSAMRLALSLILDGDDATPAASPRSAPRMCMTLGHEDVPATTIGTFDDGEGYVETDTAYCGPCAASTDECRETHVVDAAGRILPVPTASPALAPARSSIAALVVAEVNRRDLRHRKGWKPSDWANQVPSLEHLDSEVGELRDALSEISVVDVRSDAITPEVAHVREELGDVFACVLQTAYRMGMTFADLDAEAERKLRLRFEGADSIVVSHA